MSKPSTTARLVAAAIRHHADATRPAIKESYGWLVRDFAIENRERRAAGLPALLTPSAQTFVRAVRRSSLLDLWTARVGVAHAYRRLRATGDRP